ncbi:MAG TPA: DUF4382 domain-containing protein [Phycisphaerae bacterium]|nr:DUF4382 domain-containing protein [Phycisphaerae bacterium]
MFKRTFRYAIAPLLFGAVSLLGCMAFPSNFGATGKLVLQVTDKPFPVDFIAEALVTVTRVEVRQASEDENAEDGFVVIFEGERTLDLLDLRNGRTDLLAEADIPVGMYDQMRLVVTEGHITLTDDSEFDLKVPSGESSGIKLNFEFEIVEDEELVLLLDVDLSRAFSAIPSGHIDDVSTITGFHFHPAFAMRLISVLEAGQITGIVNDNADPANPVANALVTAFKDDVEVTSTVTEADGAFTLMGLPTGTYRVEFSATGFDDLTVNDVEVMAGETTDLGAVVMTPTPP